MHLRPCIDIHNGSVKQIIGGSLSGDTARENFVSAQDAAYYADMYRRDRLPGGHVILLNHRDSDYYKKTKAQALSALAAFPGGLMAGGGIDPFNAAEFLDAGASHVIVTSYVFRNGLIDRDRLAEMEHAAGKERLVLDLSCRKQAGRFLIVTDRWTKMTDTELNAETLEELAGHCAEFLVHAVDEEGKQAGINKEVFEILAAHEFVPVTYAGGIRSLDDVMLAERLGCGRVDITIGSALDIFGGKLPYKDVVEYMRRNI
ncbi:MAG: phosphoribosylformimino-5-aminoimidazole carboxamide ribotide isomerase [Lachnospiraceae bacterium]|nr:phosphoribosylformimino-5-aminoimidazole carboxamide ribotide isomerase [Lachnospiraceae bacterium]